MANACASVILCLFVITEPCCPSNVKRNCCYIETAIGAKLFPRAGPPPDWLPSVAVPSPAHLAWLAHGLLLRLCGAAACPGGALHALNLECRVMAHWIGRPAETEAAGTPARPVVPLATQECARLAALFLRGAAPGSEPDPRSGAALAAPPAGAPGASLARAGGPGVDEAAGQACESHARLGTEWPLVAAFVAAQPALAGALTVAHLSNPYGWSRLLEMAWTLAGLTCAGT